MTVLVALVILGAAFFFVLRLAGGPDGRQPITTVDDFAQAMQALGTDRHGPTRTRR